MLECLSRCGVIFTLLCFVGMMIGCGRTETEMITLSPSAAILLPSQTLQFTANVDTAGPPPTTWFVNGVAGGSSATGTITSGGLYTAPADPVSMQIQVSVQDGTAPARIVIFNPSNFAGGVVSSTQNALVAAYSISSPAGTSVHVHFGSDTNYGLSTSGVAGPPNGGAVTVLVAGLRAGTTYHMQAVLDLINGSKVLDADKTFTTGTVPASKVPSITAQASGVGTPSAGLELFSLVPSSSGEQYNAVATDLEGNLVWYYDLGSGMWAFPIIPLPNGHMLLVATSTHSLQGNEIREIDLAGNVFNRITLADVNQGIAGVTSFQINAFHHDVLPLPNGHLILLGNYSVTANGVPGVADGTVIAGDALIDWDPERGPVWTWSTFDHLDLARAPYGIANGVQDWTHANAVIYSPSDRDLILSMRNQNWIIKIDYEDGTGSGDILWRFGPDGDFTLPGQEAPAEWNYGQHYMTVVSPNSSGIFSMMFFNNGNNRLMDQNNTVCGSPGVSNCYSSVPIFQLDESTKTATVLWEDQLLPAYSICCGNALLLPNGDFEFDIADDIGNPNISRIEEVTGDPTHQQVWRMDVQGQLAYRGFRIPSLYPGQVWSADMLSRAGGRTSVGPTARIKDARGGLIP